MVLETKEKNSFILNAGKIKIEDSTEVSLFRAKFYKQLKHKIHIEELRRKTAYKIHVLREIRKYSTVEKAS